MPHVIDPTDFLGRTFSRLTVQEVLPKNDKGRWMYRCLCACGNECVLPRNKLRHDGTQSCGCLRTEMIRRNAAVSFTRQQRRTADWHARHPQPEGIATCL